MIVVKPGEGNLAYYKKHIFCPQGSTVMYFVDFARHIERLRALVRVEEGSAFQLFSGPDATQTVSFPRMTYDATLAICAFHGIPTDELTCLVFRPEVFL